METMQDLFDYLLNEARPETCVIQADPSRKDIFRTLGRLAGFTGVFLTRFQLNGAILLLGNNIACGIESLWKGKPLHVRRLEVIYS